jgi:serine protease
VNSNLSRLKSNLSRLKSNLSRSKLRTVLFAVAGVLLYSATTALAQVEPGVVRIQIAADRSEAIANEFAKLRPSADRDFAHSNIYSVSAPSDAVLQDILGIPGSIGVARLAPWLPTHSVAFPDIRRRSNPELFSQPVTATSAVALRTLAAAEEKLSRWFTLRFDPALPVKSVIAGLRKSAGIVQVEAITARKPLFIPNDSLVPMQYALPLMHAFEAWDVVRCDSSMLVADVDIGTDWSHPDLAGAIYVNKGEVGIDASGLDKRANGVDDDGNGLIDDWHGWDFDGPDGASPDNDTRSPESHGTHTAGILAASGNNLHGIAGIAFGAKLLAIKASDESGQSLDFGFDGIAYAADMHAKVVSCSWGGPTRSQAEQDVVDYAFGKDCAVVAASGNSGFYQEFFPASYDHVLSVGAIESDALVAGYTNFNTRVDVDAPGTDILSTMPGGWYFQLTGTSMACPNAAGALALVRARYPELSALAAMELLRVTSEPLDTSAGAEHTIDGARFDLVGHGLVNIAKAVTDTNEHSARIEGFAIKDTDANAHIEPGETAGIELTVRNILQSVNALHAHIEVVQGQEAVAVLTPDIVLGSMPKNGVITSDPALFRVKASDSLDRNLDVIFKVIFSDSSVGYYRDVDYFHFVINPDYLDLDANNLTVTFSSKGTIGYNDVISNNEGSGFQWRVPPPQINARGRNVVFQAGLLIGSDQDHVVDAVQTTSEFSIDNDFVPLSRVHYVTPDRNALQELASTFDDSGADSTRRIGVIVDHSSYAFSGGLAANAVVVQYRISQAEASAPMFLNAGIFADWDVGLSGAVNVTYLDTATSIAITHRLEADYPWVGVKLIGPVPSGARVNYHAIRNDGSEGDIGTYDGFSVYEKWLALTEGYPTSGPGDVSNSIGLANMTLATAAPDTLTAIIALAESEEALRATVAATETAWNGVARVQQATADLDVLAYPSPFREVLNVTVPRAHENTLIRIADLLGREVFSTEIHGAHARLPLNLAPGSYILSVTSGDDQFSKVIVSTR